MKLVCCYCGRDVPPGVEPAMFACCKEIGKTCTLEQWEQEEAEAEAWHNRMREISRENALD